MALRLTLIPPPFDGPHCIALKSDGKRCGGKTKDADLAEAMRLTRTCRGLSQNERIDVVRRIIALHVCTNTHREGLDFEILHASVKDYERWLLSNPERVPPTLLEATPEFVMFEGSGPDLKTKLQRPLNDPRGPGVVYILRLDQAPGYLKIGSSCDFNDRFGKLQKCYPGLKLYFAIEFDFPKRMEELIHIQLHHHRHQNKCSRCRVASHTEWFKIEPEHAVTTVLELWKLSNYMQFYTDEKRLSQFWLEKITCGRVITWSALQETIPKGVDDSLPPRSDDDDRAIEGISSLTLSSSLKSERGQGMSYDRDH